MPLSRCHGQKPGSTTCHTTLLTTMHALTRLAARSPAAGPLSRRAVTPAPSVAVARRAFVPMAFRSSKQEQLAGQARRYVQTWGEVAARGLDAVKQDLRQLLAEDVMFEADGVVYTQNLQGLPAVLEALEREHSRYEHCTYFPLVVAANEDDNKAFVGVAWEFKSSATNETSRGFSIKQLTFDPASGKISHSRVNRQMTAEERQALVKPDIKCQPADVFADVLPKLGWGTQEAAQQFVAEEECANKMQTNLMTWVHCWSSDTDIEQLNHVLAPEVMAYDAYGLHHAADRPGREGHAISLMGRDDAKASIAELHRKFNDRNTLLSFAVNPDQRVAFDHWRGEAQGRDSDVNFVTEGVDMILFNDACQISTLVQFDMQDYSKLLVGQTAAPAGADP